MPLRYSPGQSGDKYAILTEHFLNTKANSSLDRKRYYYWQIYNITGLAGVVVYTDMTRTACNIHVHAPGLLNRTTLRVMFDYPFRQLGLQKVFGTIRSDNISARKNAEKIGFKIEHTFKDYYAPGIDMVVYVIDRDKAQRWTGSPQPKQDRSEPEILEAVI